MTNHTTEFMDQMLRTVSDSIIIGLCGKRCAGCSAVSGILSLDWNQLAPVFSSGDDEYSHLEQKENKILLRYAEKNWRPFEVIETDALITASVLIGSPKELTDFLAAHADLDEMSRVQLNEICKAFFEHTLDAGSPKKTNRSFTNRQLYQLFLHGSGEDEACQAILKQYICKGLPVWSRAFWEHLKALNPAYSLLGFPLLDFYCRTQFKASESEHTLSQNGDPVVWLAEQICRAVNLILNCNQRVHKATSIVIDSVQNYFISKVLEARYSNYYSVAIYAKDEVRARRWGAAASAHALPLEVMDALDTQTGFWRYYQKFRYFKDDNFELPLSLQNQATYQKLMQIIHAYVDASARSLNQASSLERQLSFQLNHAAFCMEQADIIIENSEDSGGMADCTKQLVRYVCLMLHPGLLLPTPQERSMQFAHTAKLNSGCISRQVGAVVTDVAYHILSLGWNEQTDNHLPCLYQDLEEIGGQLTSDEHETLKQEYQRKQQESETSQSGVSERFCYNDVYHCLHPACPASKSRALHAEAMALQNIAFPAQAVDGYLFATASPCAHCLNLARQYRIKKIYYLQHYPGTPDLPHTDREAGQYPELIPMTGAIGKAYHKLYSPLLPGKREDELRNQFRI